MTSEEELIAEHRKGTMFIGETRVPLEDALLIVSGLETEEGMAEYGRKLDAIHRGFWEFKGACAGNAEPSQTETARMLFDYFWYTKPDRFLDMPGYNVLLADAVDAQLSEDSNQRVGNCFGLTSLYSVVGVREGLNLSILSLRGHIMNRLRERGAIVNIENSLPDGFDFKVEGGFESSLYHLIPFAYFEWQTKERTPQ